MTLVLSVYRYVQQVLELSTCRSVVVSLGQMASLEDDHSQSVGGGLVTQGEQ